MPDLSDIQTPVMLSYALNTTLRATGPRNRKAAEYLMSFIRLSDKAVYEYGAARTALTEFLVSRNQLSVYFRTVAHLETCISSLRRALGFMEHLKGSLRNPGLPRESRRAIERNHDMVAGLRNCIEHMDEWIQQDRVARGTPIMLVVAEQGDAMSIADQTMTFEVLAALVRTFHSMAATLAAYREAASPGHDAALSTD